MPIFFIILGLIFIWKIFNEGLIDGLAQFARGLFFFGIAGGFLFGAISGQWAVLIGLCVVGGLFYGLRFLADAAKMQNANARPAATPVNEPRPEPTRDWNWDSE